ncbi:MAG: hypothetical protein SFZ23_12360 [Planctomycetota bacterium]|nr:hypothetical protein [Planctomycetota bacterium]
MPTARGPHSLRLSGASTPSATSAQVSRDADDECPWPRRLRQPNDLRLSWDRAGNDARAGVDIAVKAPGHGARSPSGAKAAHHAGRPLAEPTNLPTARPTAGPTRADTSPDELAPSLAPTDARWVLAVLVRQSLEGGRAAVLRPERRHYLLDQAERMGLRPFDANLIIAIAQDATRSGRELDLAAAGQLSVIAPPSQRRTPSLLLAASLTVALGLLAAGGWIAWLLA